MRTPQGPQKRKYRRYSIIGTAELRQSPDDAAIEAYTISISLGGIGLYAEKPLENQVYVTLFFTDADGRDVGETIVGRIAWQKPYGRWYAMGIEFQNLNPHDHPMTIEFLNQQDFNLHKSG